MAKTVKSIVELPDGNVIITYTDLSTEKKPASAASAEIATAKLGGRYQNNPTAFGTTNATGANVNLSTVPTQETLGQFYQKALSSSADGYSKIRTSLVNAGLISKGTKSLSSVQNAWLSVLQGAVQDQVDPFTYINKIKSQGAGLDIAGNEPPKPYEQIGIYDPTKAKDVITGVIVDLLHREPTPEEIATLTNKLTAAQKKNGSTTNYVKDKSGKTIATTTGGLDEMQFLTDLVKKIKDPATGKPEFEAVQGRLTNTATQQVQNAALANGVTLSQQQLDDFSNRVKNGESVSNIASTIRSLAKIGQPESIGKLLDSGVDLETIYQPYKQTMASVLELNPNSITLNDPTLRSAIGPDKEQSLYEYQRSLRKDPRWQYTNNARSETADAVTTVLKDFGFMG